MSLSDMIPGICASWHTRLPILGHHLGNSSASCLRVGLLELAKVRHELLESFVASVQFRLKLGGVAPGASLQDRRVFPHYFWFVFPNVIERRLDLTRADAQESG